MSKNKPDQVADNPSILPYASNVGAPAIKPSNLTSFKEEKLAKTNKYFSSRYEEIKEEYKKLMESYEWNQLIYNCSFSFKPEKGEIYHLYQRNDQNLFLSIIGPTEWNEIYIGSFRLDSNDKWEKVDIQLHND
ncbi:MAG: GTP-binding protein [Flavobacteriaceae bacterium]|jgi:hypothetical protein|nr:GTP-binding protein [Flavobacteriaceae bacterium]|tara:strand:+ start:2053 stop:2451 length:399 start_codon:yes stop_codon:yes gene_type:complete